MFRYKAFLTEQLGSRDNVLGLFSAYGLTAPAAAAVEKWFSRERIPSEWLPTILAILELEMGKPVRLSSYLNFEEQARNDAHQ